MNNNRYTVEEIKARTSERTFQGMSLKIDDLAAIGRVLSIQDDAYDERFEKIDKALRDQQSINEKILSALQDLEAKINALSEKVDRTRGEMEGIAAKVDCLDKDVQKLKKINSITAIAIRIGIGVAIALGISALLFG